MLDRSVKHWNRVGRPLDSFEDANGVRFAREMYDLGVQNGEAQVNYL